uniref:Reverse transcriptase domain-containing protein n=1 Tax=Tanacetum cinerariifolium TaxID=118510 RepID=A0A6L2NBK3_TANCI|nr:hypothetical protein [Tanacetum cinerariifolium]
MVDHDSKWIEEEEERDPKEVRAVSIYPKPESIGPLEWKASENQLKPSMIEPPKLELKELPKHIEYDFLQGDDQLPVVISSALFTPKKSSFLKWIDSSFCAHKILMEDEFKPTVQPQRRVNLNIKEEGMTVFKNEKNELIPQRTVTGWRVCIDYHKLNDTTQKDHFTLPFIDEMLERLDGHANYCFLDGFSSSFDHCLENLEKMLKRCEETNLVLNWKKCHFMVTEGIVLGHKVLGQESK